MGKTLFVLASKSPRRKELLKNIGIDAQIMPADIDETVYENLPPEKMVTQLAMLKASDVARSFNGNTYIIGADTCVCLGNEVFGKPKDDSDAERMLKKLSGKTHEVYTGYCVVDCKSGISVAKCEKTLVTFRELSSEETEAYIKSREPMDKAGGYGIQTGGSKFVRKIEGDYFNVVGLPVCSLVELLQDEFGVRI